MVSCAVDVAGPQLAGQRRQDGQVEVHRDRTEDGQQAQDDGQRAAHGLLAASSGRSDGVGEVTASFVIGSCSGVGPGGHVAGPDRQSQEPASRAWQGRLIRVLAEPPSVRRPAVAWMPWTTGPRCASSSPRGAPRSPPTRPGSRCTGSAAACPGLRREEVAQLAGREHRLLHPAGEGQPRAAPPTACSRPSPAPCSSTTPSGPTCSTWPAPRGPAPASRAAAPQPQQVRPSLQHLLDAMTGARGVRPQRPPRHPRDQPARPRLLRAAARRRRRVR